jgi:hypothetical protein
MMDGELTVEQAEAQHAEAVAARDAAVAAVDGPRAALVALEHRIHIEEPVSRDERRRINAEYQAAESAASEARVWAEWTDRCARVARGEPVDHGFAQIVGGASA